MSIHATLLKEATEPQARSGTDWVPPTVTGRIAALDVLRGIAILGILPANIAAFGLPIFEQLVTRGGTELKGTDLWVQALQDAFVTGKFRSMLAILFGVGLHFQYVKRRHDPNAWPGGYLKRTLYLALFGLAHGYLIWWGDILFQYAVVAFVACLFAGLDEKWIRRIGWSSLGLALTISVVAVLAIQFAVPEGVRDVPGTLSAERELAVFGSGAFVEQLGLRFQFFTLNAVSSLPFALWLLPLFLFGMLLGRAGALDERSSDLRTARRLVAFGLLVGLPLNLGGLVLDLSGLDTAGSLAPELIWGQFLAAGYIGAGALWVRSGRGVWLQEAIARVGRTALSNYLLQSVLCTFVFYSWGLGWMGKLVRMELLGVVVAVWVANLFLSWMWLRTFAMGPAEWLWRSLTESRRIPIRLRDYVSKDVADPAERPFRL